MRPVRPSRKILMRLQIGPSDTTVTALCNNLSHVQSSRMLGFLFPSLE